MRIAILQPEVPHYREAFFAKLTEKVEGADLYVYNSFAQASKSGFRQNRNGLRHIGNINIKGILLYNPFTLVNNKYDTLVLMLHFAHITTWLLLMTKWIHRKKIILWGQGISVKRYLKEEQKPDWRLRWMMTMADGVWLYTEKELEMWRKVLPRKKMAALCNTVSGVEEMVEYRGSKGEMRKKYGIREERILLFCARFVPKIRRTDLLIEAIEKLDTHRFGFIIIGNGPAKPDFSKYKNVYDFGALYDNEVKRELFSCADLYFQPGWVGLSIVEAMAYGLPICTFRRSEDTLQCVEYSYIEPKRGIIFDKMEQCVGTLTTMDDCDIKSMGVNARRFVAEHLTIGNMADRAMQVLRTI